MRETFQPATSKKPISQMTFFDAFAQLEIVVAAGNMPAFIKEAEITADSSPKTEPRYVRTAVNELRSSLLSWSDMAAKKEQRTALHLRGVPKNLCEESLMKALLNSHRLLENVASVRIVPSTNRHTGSVILVATSPDKVAAIAKFFHGRSFYGARPIAVSFATGEEELPKWIKRSKLAAAEPVKLHIPALADCKDMAAELSPTASTDIGVDSYGFLCSSGSLDDFEPRMVGMVEPPPGLEHVKDGDSETSWFSSAHSSLEEMPAWVTMPPGLEKTFGTAIQVQ